jgi:mannan endo-1,4-beta-mannosidase
MYALVDAAALSRVHQLHDNLRRLSGDNILFGHQEPLAYGYDWIGEDGRSDVREVTGAYPSVYGWDFYPLTAHHADDRYGMTRDNLLRWVQQGAARGGVITFSWHAPHPVTGGSFNDKEPAVAAILPGGRAHAKFCATLDELADFFHAAAPIPIVFRPYHEHNGDWFWWGKGPATEQEFISLWRFTVEYLRDRKGVHNLLYAFSPDRSRLRPESEQDYFYGYPGDDYVDILGLDNYYDVGSHWNQAPADQQKADFIKSLELVVKLAERHDKIPALTESGLDQLKIPHWWMDRMYAGLNANAQTRKIAYVMVWRNANRQAEGSDHFYVPHRGHPGVEDFKAFKNTDLILFEDELPGWFTGQTAAQN